MSTNGNSNKAKLMTESPVIVIKIQASIKNKILHKYDENCLKFRISLPA